jgi:hypothetical protein
MTLLERVRAAVGAAAAAGRALNAAAPLEHDDPELVAELSTLADAKCLALLDLEREIPQPVVEPDGVTALALLHAFWCWSGAVGGDDDCPDQRLGRRLSEAVLRLAHERATSVGAT